MRYSIEIILNFHCKASDGVVTGNGNMVSHFDDFLPRIGEMIMPGSGDSYVNVVTEKYQMQVMHIHHFLGGDRIRLFYCDVTSSTICVWSGENHNYPLSSMNQVIDDWESLVNHYNNGIWDKENRRGSFIVSLILNDKYIR